MPKGRDMSDFVVSDHLVAFLLDLCAAFVAAWIFARYYPSWIDYRARRSRVTAVRRAARLEERFHDYGKTITNPSIFIAMIIRRGYSLF
jgi:hypothetical protein